MRAAWLLILLIAPTAAAAPIEECEGIVQPVLPVSPYVRACARTDADAPLETGYDVGVGVFVLREVELRPSAVCFHYDRVGGRVAGGVGVPAAGPDNGSHTDCVPF